MAAVLRGPWDHLAHSATGHDSVRRTELQRLQNAGSAEDRVRSDYRGRYAIELLQNAHDACADARLVGEAWLELTPTALLVANQGVPFTAKRIDSMLQLGDSTKAADRARHHTIGYKGIGFSAVLEITDRPQIVSRTLSFSFDRAAARARVGQVLGSEPRAVPMRYFPFPLDPEDLGTDAAAVQRLLGAGAVTVVRLPFRNRRVAKEVRDELESGLRPETLLFMPHLNRLTITSAGQTSGWSRRAGVHVGPGRVQHLKEHGGRTHSWLIATGTVNLDQEVVEALEDPLWSTVRAANVAVGVPWRDGKPDTARGNQPMHVYFPTDDRTGRALLVHGDFYVQSNRRRITAAGRGADISCKIAEGAAALVGDLAEALVSHGNALLRALAPSAEPDGFGAILSEMIDTRLRTCRIVLPASGGPPTAAASVKRADAELDPRQIAALVSLLDEQGDVLRAGDDAGCQQWLNRLGAARLAPSEIARRLSPKPGASYDGTLSVLARWHATLQGYDATNARQIMHHRPLLQDRTGRWSTPQRLIRSDPRTPAMPRQLAKPEYQPPSSRTARDFANEALPVEALTPQKALRAVLDYVRARDASQEAPDVLRFLRDLWRSDPALLRAAGRDEPGRIGRVPVPARVLGRREIVAGFAAADTVYFDKRWTNNEVLERIYGPFRQKEFLAADPPAESAEAHNVRQFWQVLGVRDVPRTVPISSCSSPAVHAWRGLEEVQAAAVCPDRHTGSNRDYRGVVLDRLDQVLLDGDDRAIRALAGYLCGTSKPLGDLVTVVCMHKAHARPRGTTAIGYQRWLLTTNPWLPSDGGPGGRRMRLPQDVWVEVPRGPARAVLPSPSLTVTDPPKLGLSSVHRPRIERLEAALVGVHGTFPELEQAPADARDGATWLLRKIDASAVSLPSDGPPREVPALPARRDGRDVWCTTPLIADLPGAEDVPGLAWLPPAPWTGLQRAYRLKRASAAVTAMVTDSPVHRDVRPLLTRPDRVNLLALLINRGGEAGSLAYRLGNLDERRVSALTVTYRMEGRSWLETPAYHLELRRDSAGRVRSAELRSRIELEVPDLVQLGQVLARHLGVDELADLVGQYLIVREPLMSAHRILPTQLSEAGQALGRYRSGGPDRPHAPERPEDPAEEAAIAQDEADHRNPGTDAANGKEPINGTGPRGADSSGPATPYTSSSRIDQETTPSSDRSMQEPTTAKANMRDLDETRRSRIEPAPRRDSVHFGRATRSAGQARAVRRPTPTARDRTGARLTGEASAGPTSQDAASRQATEKAAEDIAIRYLVDNYGAHVERVGSQNLGWDLNAVLPDGNRLLVEVKGFGSSSNDFVITRNELRAARAHTAQYRVCVVTGVGSDRGTLAWFDDASPLVDDHLEPYQWIVVDWPRGEHNRSDWSDHQGG